MKLGFTGSRTGLTTDQKVALLEFFVTLPADTLEAHHGMCVGADEEFHNLVIKTYEGRNRRVVGHPPVDKKYYANMTVDSRRRTKDYSIRNKDIVEESEVLVACPNSPERTRSGTWATVRYAIAMKKKITIILPDGQIEIR